MIDEDKQTAADPADDQPKAGTEADGAPDTKTDDIDLNSALDEFNAGTGSAEQKAGSKDPDVASELQSIRERLAEREYREDLSKVITAVRGDFAPDEVDDEFIDTWLNAQARKDARVAQAWLNRHKDPKGFERVVGGLKRSFAEKHERLRKRDEDATADREAVTQAVRSRKPGSGGDGGAPNYSNLSDNEFREKVEKEHGFSPL